MKGNELAAGAAPGAATGVTLTSGPGVAVIAASVLASMVGFLDANVVNVAIPAIGGAFDAGTSALQWCLTGYLLTVASLLLVSGALSDRYGRKRVLQAGLLVMFAASVLCAAAPTIEVLIAARVVQGVGAALVVPSSLALLNGSLAPAARARGIGIWAGIATLGTTVGPYAGGWLVDHASWRWIFVLNLPLIVCCLATLRPVPDSRVAGGRLSLDVWGGVVLVVGTGGAVYALTSGPDAGWTDPLVVITALVSLAALVAVVPLERSRPAPILKLSLFGSHQFSAINVTTVLFYGALAASSYLVVLQCQLQLSYSAAAAGAALIPSSVVFLAVSPLSGALVSRLGPRWLMVAGIAIVGASFVVMSTAQPGTSYATSLLPGALLSGLGLGLAVTPLTAAVLAAVDDRDLGEAAAINDAASRLGGVIAIALVPAAIGAVAGTSLGEALAAGYQSALLGLAGFCAAAAAITAAFVSDDGRAAPRFGPPQPHGCVPPQPATTTLTTSEARP